MKVYLWKDEIKKSRHKLRMEITAKMQNIVYYL